MLFELRRCTAATNTHFQPSCLSLYTYIQIFIYRARARSLALSRSVSLCLSRSLVLVPSSDLRSAFRSPLGVAIVVVQRSSSASSSSSTSDINQASSCRHRQARNALKQFTSKDFFGMTWKRMIHRPHDRQHRRDIKGILLIGKRTFGFSTPTYLFVARSVANIIQLTSRCLSINRVSVQSVTQRVHTGKSKGSYGYG